MLKVRIVPTLLWKSVGLVKGVRFDSWRRVGAVLPAIKVYNTREVDELVLVDIMASREAREPDYESINEFSAECFMPLTVGGGVCRIEHIRELLKAGADKVAVNSACFENPALLDAAAGRFGSQCIVASLDARREADGRHQCYSHSGTRPTGREAGEWAAEMQRRGAGEILVTSIDRDGTMEGYDIDLIRRVTESVGIPVIASGGAGNYEHMWQALTRGEASAVAAASIFHFTEQTPLQAKRYLAARGIPVRAANAVLMGRGQ